MMSEDRVIYRLPDIELSAHVAGDERRAALEETLSGPRGFGRHWSRGLGWVPPVAPLLRARGPYLPDLWTEGE